MRNLYFVQINDVYVNNGVRNVYIPYAAGCIEAYCLQNEKIAGSFRFGKIVYCKDRIENIIAGFDDPFMVLFSCSVWNTRFSLALAEAVKKAFPGCYTAIGGHQVSADISYLEDNPFVDFLMHRAGEEPTAQLLIALSEGREPSDVPNISYRDSDGNVVTTGAQPQTGSDYPSPYLCGIFDDILKDDITFSCLFETNRGCPNSCAFCDWGALKTKIRQFSLDRVFAEIDWFVSHKIDYIYCADANFCLFDRDEKIVDYIIHCNKTYGYPKFFHVNFTKNKLDFVFEISTKMVTSGLSKAQTISFQSLDPEVLKNIGRKNMPIEHFRELMRRFSERNIATYSELILGLPGETYDSFCDGLCTLIENGQHFSVNVYPCELLPNSVMGNKAYQEKYGIKGTRIPFRLMHGSGDDGGSGITEYSVFVTSTASMHEDDWARSLLFASCVQGFHNLGLLRAVAVYCRVVHDTSYLDFYQSFLSFAFANADRFSYRLVTGLLALCAGVSGGKNEFVASCEGTEGIMWGFDELSFLEAYKELDAFYADVLHWLIITYGDEEGLRSVLDFQRAVIKRIGADRIVIRAPYDFYDFLKSVYNNDPHPPVKKDICLEITDTSPVKSFAELARNTVWYGRNRREPDYTAGYYPVKYI